MKIKNNRCLLDIFLWIFATSIHLAHLQAGESGSSLWDIVYKYTPSYGNYCGPNMTYGGPSSLVCPLPIDDMDAACAAHDYLYSHTTETDYYSRALADLKLTGSFLTSPATSLKSLTYSTAGSIAMPLQSIRWAAQGINNEANQSLNTIEPTLKEYQKVKTQEQRAYQEQQKQYYAEVMRINNEKYSRLLKLSEQRADANAKQEIQYWSEYYDKLMKQAAQKYSNPYH